MPRGDKSKYTDKQKRKAEHIEESYESRGVPREEAERRAWATVNKTDRGVEKPGSSTITTQFTGSFRDNPDDQVRFITMVRGLDR